MKNKKMGKTLVVEFSNEKNAKLAFDNFKKIMSSTGNIGVEKVSIGNESYSVGDGPTKKKCKCINCGKPYQGTKVDVLKADKPNYFG